MDRRRFIFQGMAATGACAMPFTLLAKSGLPNYLTARPGKLNDNEFSLILKEAKAQGKGVLLHPASKVVLNRKHTIEVSILGSGSKIIAADDALTFINKTKGTQVINGIHFKGRISLKESKDQIFSQNTFESQNGIVISGEDLFNLKIENNVITAHSGHAISLKNDIASKLQRNKITVLGEGHFAWLENTAKGEVTSNEFKGASGYGSTIVVMNEGDVNPHMVLKNNKLV